MIDLQQLLSQLSDMRGRAGDAIGMGDAYAEGLARGKQLPGASSEGQGDAYRNMVIGAQLARTSPVPRWLQNAGAYGLEAKDAIMRNPFKKESWRSGMQDIHNFKAGQQYSDANPQLSLEQLFQMMQQKAGNAYPTSGPMDVVGTDPMTPVMRR
jgi:hypothetical protein